MSHRELALSFKEQIRSFHQQSLQLDEQIKSLVVAKLNATRACGIAIQEMRDSLAPEEFHGVVKDLAIDSDTVRAYVSFAKKNHAKFDNFTIAIRAAFEAALHASGALPPPRDMGVQTSHDPPKFFSWTSAMVMQFVMRWKKFLSAKPLKSWGVSEAEQFIYGLRPILKVHATVSNWIKEQQRP